MRAHEVRDDLTTGKVWRGWPSTEEIDASAVTIGVFDGFHRGHVALVEQARAEATSRGVAALLVTFEPHPLAVLAPDRAPVQLLSVDDRVAMALALGVDGVVVLPFTKELAARPAEAFVEDLVERLGMRALVVGGNFRCGRAGEGDTSYLRRAGRQHGFDVHDVDLIHRGTRRCSSTEVRRALAAGDVAGAFDLLGRSDPRIAAVAVS